MQASRGGGRVGDLELAAQLVAVGVVLWLRLASEPLPAVSQFVQEPLTTRKPLTTGGQRYISLLDSPVLDDRRTLLRIKVWRCLGKQRHIECKVGGGHSVVTNYTTTPAFYGSSTRQEIAMPSVNNKRQALMGNTEKTCGARNAAA